MEKLALMTADYLVAQIRAGADLVLDGGELPGTASTVADFSAWESEGTFEVVREGALPVDAMVRSLR